MAVQFKHAFPVNEDVTRLHAAREEHGLPSVLIVKSFRHAVVGGDAGFRVYGLGQVPDELDTDLCPLLSEQMEAAIVVSKHLGAVN